MEHLFNIDPDAFNPPSRVDSVIVRLTPFVGPPHLARNSKLLEWAVREAFNQRRKTLRNTLKPLLSVEDIKAAGVNPTLRPEQLNLAAFICLANRLAELPGNRQSDETLVRSQASHISDTQHQVNVRVDTYYLPEQFALKQNHFTFAYTVTIGNQGEVPTQLLSHHQIIIDDDGRTQEVRDVGAVGGQPLIVSGVQHAYTSSTMLAARVDSMRDSYQMLGSDGIASDAAIPILRLAIPGALH